MKASVIFSLFFLLLGVSFQAEAFLENLRHGYTSCATCHYNHQGGGLLTGYGQALGSEIMFAKKSDELGESELSSQKWFRAGVDLRALQILKDDKDKTKATFIPMQADAHALVLLPRVQLQATYGAKSTNSFSKRKTEWLFRSYSAQVEILKSLHLKLGLFLPPFGLPLVEHNLFIKKHLGFDQNQETKNVLLSSAHGSMAYDFYRFEREQIGEDKVSGNGGQFRVYLAEKHLISMSHQSTEKQKKYGLASFISLPFAQSALMLEADEVYNDGSRGRVSLVRLLMEQVQGFKPYLQHETFNPDIQTSESEIVGWAVGLQALPVKSIDFGLQAGQNRFGNGDKETVAFLNLHYYWQTP